LGERVRVRGFVRVKTNMGTFIPLHVKRFQEKK
jgi:hypothetical protein